MNYSWENITVFQWQQIVEALKKVTSETQDFDIDTLIASIVTGKTEAQIDSLPLDEVRSLFVKTKFVNEELKPKPLKYISVNGRRYRCIYDVRKIPAARYIETKHFGNDVPGNLHRIAACMVMPQKKHWLFGWKDDKYDAGKHSDYAQDMLEAPITAIYGSVVFFYLVFRGWIKISKDYLKQEMMSKGMTEYQAESLYIHLCESMDGFIKHQSLPSMKESRWSKYMRSRLYNF